MTSDRLKLPLLAVAQAQKEMTHNEALAQLELVVQAVVVAVAPGAVPTAPVPGQCWIVGAAPSGAWAGRAGAIAGWTAGGWRFVDAFEGMQVWSIADGANARREGTAWVVGKVTAASVSVAGNQVVGARQPRVVAPSGGASIDTEARAAIAALIAGLQAHGLFAAA